MNMNTLYDTVINGNCIIIMNWWVLGTIIYKQLFIINYLSLY